MVANSVRGTARKRKESRTSAGQTFALPPSSSLDTARLRFGS